MWSWGGWTSEQVSNAPRWHAPSGAGLARKWLEHFRATLARASALAQANAEAQTTS